MKGLSVETVDGDGKCENFSLNFQRLPTSVYYLLYLQFVTRNSHIFERLKNSDYRSKIIY